MKYCSKCERRYSDDSLSYCLDDGTLLSRVPADPLDTNATLPYSSAAVTEEVPPPTEIFPQAAARAAPTVAAIHLKDALPRTVVTRSSNPILTAAVITIALLLVIITGLAVVFLWRLKSSEQGKVQPDNRNLAGAAVSPTPVLTRGSTATIQAGTGEEDLQQQKTPLKIKVTASSVRLSVQSNTYTPDNVMDGTRKTAWIEGVDGPGLGEWLRFDFDREINLHRILILPGYFKSAEIWKMNNRLAAATFSFSDGSSQLFNFPDRMERQSLDVGSVKTRWVRLTIDNVYFGTDPDTAISEIAFEWEP